MSTIPRDKDNPQDADVVALLREAGEERRAMGELVTERIWDELLDAAIDGEGEEGGS